MRTDLPNKAIRLADATISALAAGDDYHELLDGYDSRIATKRQTAKLEAAERRFLRLSSKAYRFALQVKKQVA